MEVKVAQSCPVLCNPTDCSPWDSPGQNTGVGSLSLLQGIFPTQGSNPGLPHCRQILYQLSHQGSSLFSCRQKSPVWFGNTLTPAFPGGSVGKEAALNAEDPGSIPEAERSTGLGTGYPLQYSWVSFVAKLVKNLPAMRETWV